jgi:ubiquitin-like-conjugating enzyme ATG3
MDRVKNFVSGTYQEVAKSFMSVLKESKFYEEGVLTPEEFVIAGDFLTQKCPTWKWCSSKSNLKVNWLPEDKQFLMTTVPCPKRVRDYEKNNKTTENVLDDDWVETNVNFYGRKNDNNIIDIDTDNFENKKQIVINNNLSVKDNYLGDEIDIIREDSVNKIKENDDIDFIVVDQSDDDNVIKTRTYDVSVAYDFYYRVPRIWLTGYNESGILLKEDEIKEDIMLEYIDKTVTIENHPSLGIMSVSIHPCKHSLLLKKMIENFERAGKKLEVHMSVLLFLKFLHSVVPTIQYDFTMDINF